MSFGAPLWWMLLLPIPPYLWWLSRRSYAQLTPRAQWGALILRSVIFLLLLGALSQPVFSLRSSRHHLVFVLDVSKSISGENLEIALADIDRLTDEARAKFGNTAISFAAFGERARLMYSEQTDPPDDDSALRDQMLYRQRLPEMNREQTRLITAGRSNEDPDLKQLRRRIQTVEQFRDDVAGEHTNLEAALLLALNCGSHTMGRTVYVFTDANLNQGRWREMWTTASRSRSAVHPVKLDRATDAEVALTDIAVPANVRINEGLTARIRIAATETMPAELIVFKDGILVETRPIDLAAGETTVDFTGLYFREKGFHTLEATIRADGNTPLRDTQLENNRINALVVVPGPVRVLYVDRDDAQIPYLKNALEIEGIEVEARPAAGVPQNLADLLSFDAFLLSNVPADRLTRQQMRNIHTYVENFGGGFVMLGGDESFGLGGYFDTPIEEILPVRMPIQKDLNRPSLALMMVVDKSGSMSGAKIQLTKRAAISTAEVVNPRDLIGLIGFDSASRILLELTSAADRATITSQIASLEAGGGTNLYPALDDARQLLQQAAARRKHVIVLSDGQTQGNGYQQLVETMAADGQTLSAVGIGDGADMNLLETIAEAGGGRAYFTNDFSSIPQIFTREALRASKSMLVEKLVQPAVISDDISLKEIDTNELPLLMGYVATTAKEAAHTIMVSDVGDPLLARWRYGLGQTAAFTSDTKPRWAEDWLDWPDFAKFWSQLVRSLTGAQQGNSLGVELTHRTEDQGIIVTADVRDTSGNFVDDVRLASSIVDPQGQASPLLVSHTGPGRYETNIPQFEYARPQQMVWTTTQGDNPPQPTAYGFVYSFSPEFRTLGINEDVFTQMSQRGLGETMSVGHTRLLLDRSQSRRRVVLWPYLLAMAIVLIPLDILCRRMG